MHHAEHLASLRKQCGKSPLPLLKKFKAFKVSGGDSMVGVATATVTKAATGKIPQSTATSKRQTTNPKAVEEQFNSFDNMESVMEIREDSGSADSNSWGHILGQSGKPTGRAGRFTV